MPVVHVAAAGMTAAICLDAGVAIVPQLGVFAFRDVYAYCHKDGPVKDKTYLKNLPWDSLSGYAIQLGHSRILFVSVGDGQNKASTVWIRFQNKICERLWISHMMRCVQRAWRRKKKLQALVMALHPRVGANSPLNVINDRDVLAIAIHFSGLRH